MQTLHLGFTDCRMRTNRVVSAKDTAHAHPDAMHLTALALHGTKLSMKNPHLVSVGRSSSRWQRRRQRRRQQALPGGCTWRPAANGASGACGLCWGKWAKSRCWCADVAAAMLRQGKALMGVAASQGQERPMQLVAGVRPPERHRAELLRVQRWRLQHQCRLVIACMRMIMGRGPANIRDA
jgi:hypothetical protein